MKKRKLEIVLESLEELERPRPDLEQYMLSGRDAAQFLWLAIGDVVGARVLDAGCGSGRLLVGAALLGSWHAIGLDIDFCALLTAKRNALRAGVGGLVDLICCDYEKPCLREVDVVIQNPPFGVQRPHADRVFAKSSIKLARVVYSMHKAGDENRKFLRELYSRFGGMVDWIKEDVVELKPTMMHHVKRIYKVKVDIYRIVRGESWIDAT